MNPAPVAWMVVDARGRRSLYLDEARAVDQAAKWHGVVVPLAPPTDWKPEDRS